MLLGFRLISGNIPGDDAKPSGNALEPYKAKTVGNNGAHGFCRFIDL